MSKLPNCTPASSNILTVVLLKPQRGSRGVPFMNSMTGAELMSCSNVECIFKNATV
jgi:hypothetical protein